MKNKVLISLVLVILLCWLLPSFAAQQDKVITPMLGFLLQGGQITFSNGGITLHTSTTTTNNSKVTMVTDDTGQLLLTSTVTTTGVTLNFPGIEKAKEFRFPPLS